MIFKPSFTMLAVVISAFVFAGCDEGDGGSSGNHGSFIAMADLAPGAKFNDLSKSQVIAKLKDEEFLYATKPSTASSALIADKETDEDQCYAAMFDDIASTGDAQTLTFEGRFDAAKCVAADKKAALSVTIGVAAFFEFTCNNVDMTQFVGKTLKELSAADGTVLKDVICETMTFVSNLMVNTEGNGTVTENGNKQDVKFQTVTYFFQGDVDGNPCSLTTTGSEGTYAEGCLSIDRSVSLIDQVDGKATADEGTEDYARYEQTGVVKAKDDKPYYKAGTIKAQVNGWTGELTYNDAGTAPLYSLAMGTDQVEGVLGVSGSGSLRFGEASSLRSGTCGAFTIELASSGKVLMPTAKDLLIELSGAKFFADAECKTGVTNVTLKRGMSAAMVYAQQDDLTSSSFYISADPSDDTYSTFSKRIEVTGLETGSLRFQAVESIHLDDCTALIAERNDQAAFAGDVTVTLSSTKATFFSDAGCKTATTTLALKEGAKTGMVYLKANADATFSVTVNATVPEPASIGSADITIDANFRS